MSQTPKSPVGPFYRERLVRAILEAYDEFIASGEKIVSYGDRTEERYRSDAPRRRRRRLNVRSVGGLKLGQLFQMETDDYLFEGLKSVLEKNIFAIDLLDRDYIDLEWTLEEFIENLKKRYLISSPNRFSTDKKLLF